MSEKKAAAEKRHFRKNSVKGTRRGSRYPEEVKTAALADMLVCRNLSEVARKYRVPESTLRTWRSKLGKQEEKDLFEKARMEALKEISARAAKSAALSVEYMQRRLEHAIETEELRERLLTGEGIDDMELRQEELLRRRAMDDGDAANMGRTLMGILEKSREMLQDGGAGEDEDDLKVSIEVVRE